VQEAVVSTLLDADANPNATDDAGLTPLHYASTMGALNILVKLIEKQADVNAASTTSRTTPLHAAALAGGDAMVTRLVEYGAELDAQDARGYAALHYAAEIGVPKVVDVLLAHRASTTLEARDGKTPAACATRDDIKRKFVASPPPGDAAAADAGGSGSGSG